VDRHGCPDLLASIYHAAKYEVAQRPHFRGEPWLRAAVVPGAGPSRWSPCNTPIGSPKLRFRSTPVVIVPGMGWRFAAPVAQLACAGIGMFPFRAVWNSSWKTMKICAAVERSASPAGPGRSKPRGIRCQDRQQGRGSSPQRGLLGRRWWSPSHRTSGSFSTVRDVITDLDGPDTGGSS
jgi:hypothetical protein